MRPRILKIDPLNVDLELMKQAAEVISNRGLVAFPTETVYGLGANALDPKAVSGIFEAKKRPLDDPLIVHIAELKTIEELVTKVPEEARWLMDKFWPGPLTVVLEKKEIVPDIVTTGLDTVAIRMPSNSIAKKLIELSGVPIAAPSANLFGRPSPTTAEHVVDDLNGRIDLVLDGGKTDIGIESTVVECAENKVIVLRPGGISLEDLKVVVKDKLIVREERSSDRSPGKYPQHYSPEAQVVVVERSGAQTEEVRALYSQKGTGNLKVGIMTSQEHLSFYKGLHAKVLGPENDGRVSASRLFHIFREFDKEKFDVIIVEAIPEKGLGLAVMNRIRKAAGSI
ncbi:MAG: L-threonylcarbamoyladenylate synthase [Candidatus Omnitrophica bacterium]|nr:L-threonylcarbamoyladenylate synthase [Candidatus Omnitrophota bacterium]